MLKWLLKDGLTRIKCSLRLQRTTIGSWSSWLLPGCCWLMGAMFLFEMTRVTSKHILCKVWYWKKRHLECGLKRKYSSLPLSTATLVVFDSEWILSLLPAFIELLLHTRHTDKEQRAKIIKSHLIHLDVQSTSFPTTDFSMCPTRG